MSGHGDMAKRRVRATLRTVRRPVDGRTTRDVRSRARRRLAGATAGVLGLGLLVAAPAEAAPRHRATSTASSTQSVTVQRSATASATVEGVTKRATGSATVKGRGKASAKRAARASTRKQAVRLAQRRAKSAAKSLARKRATTSAASRAQVVARTRAHTKARQLATATAEAARVPADDACGTRIAKSDGTYWDCTLVEQFDGTSLDRDVWTPQETSKTAWGAPENCYVDSPEALEVGGGTLKIHTRKHDEPFTCRTPGGKRDFQSEWTSASISTWNQFTQAYGRFEFRARMPDVKVKGIHSALWMWPEDDTKYGYWPLSGEIDIAEIYTTYPDRAIPMLHYNAPWGTGKQARTNYFCMIEPSEWTTYVAEWTTEGITISYNGEVCLQHEWNALAPLQGSQPFDQPFMLAISQGLGTTGNEVTDQTPPLATMEVDWVKVWK